MIFKTAVKILAILAILFLCAIFFLISNTGIGLTALYENWKRGDPATPSLNETVMPPNSSIAATTETGTIIIKSGNGLKRYYTWDGITRYIVMWPRYERWYGSMGIYYPGPGSHWLPKHKGISRGVLEEGQQHFNTIEDAMNWIKLQKSHNPVVYRDDGLFVEYGKKLDREQLDVDVWQLFINGKKPYKLQGSNNKAILASW
jgi:hypothetical protein